MTIKKETLEDAIKVAVSSETIWMDVKLDGEGVALRWFDGANHNYASFSRDLLEAFCASLAVLNFRGNDFKDGVGL